MSDTADFTVRIVDDAGQADQTVAVVDGISGLSPSAGDSLFFDGSAWADRPIAESDLPAPEAVHLVGAVGEPVFNNDWVNFGAGYIAAGFYKYAGRVYLQGTVKDGTIGQNVFQLPVGYRPSAFEMFAATAGFAFGNIQIQGDGLVIVTHGANSVVSLSGISFRA